MKTFNRAGNTVAHFVVSYISVSTEYVGGEIKLYNSSNVLKQTILSAPYPTSGFTQVDKYIQVNSGDYIKAENVVSQSTVPNATATMQGFFMY